jgi:hypothetical protein
MANYGKRTKTKKARELLKDLTAINTLYRTTPNWIKEQRAKIYRFLKKQK